MSKSVSIVCRQCGKEFSVPPSWGKRKFCSKPCKDLGLKEIMKGKNSKEWISLKCQTCSKFFQVMPYRKKAKFCSNDCMNIFRKTQYLATNSVLYKDGRWSYRRLAFNKFDKICSMCGATDKLEVHHIDENRSNNSIENLQIVCSKCHKSLHPR